MGEFYSVFCYKRSTLGKAKKEETGKKGVLTLSSLNTLDGEVVKLPFPREGGEKRRPIGEKGVGGEKNRHVFGGGVASWFSSDHGIRACKLRKQKVEAIEER